MRRSLARDFGSRLRNVRIARRQTQAALADAAGISRQTLSRIESHGSGTIESLMAVIASLGLDGQLLAVLPDPAISPVAYAKLQRKRARRVRHKKSPSQAVKEWRWGDET